MAIHRVTVQAQGCRDSRQARRSYGGSGCLRGARQVEQLDAPVRTHARSAQAPRRGAFSPRDSHHGRRVPHESALLRLLPTHDWHAVQGRRYSQHQAIKECASLRDIAELLLCRSNRGLEHHVDVQYIATLQTLRGGTKKCTTPAPDVTHCRMRVVIPVVTAAI